jgi:aryl-alcohol dehydrogenase-like predicted oxidoreductase
MTQAHTIPTVALGTEGLQAAHIGLGCMVLSGMYAPPDLDESVATFYRAVELGITLLDTANSYSRGANELFLADLLAPVRDRVVVSTKFGLEPQGDGIGVNARPETALRCCDESLQRLAVDQIDLYYAHRPDPVVPIEETVGAMSELVAAGKVKYVGVCEVTGDQLRRAHATHPISALQSEWSLFERRNEQGTFPVARELGIGIVPYSPLGRGFLTGAITAEGALSEGDLRNKDIRFIGDNLTHNLGLVDVVRKLAASKGATPAQIALAWLLAQGDDVVPIPGAERREYLEENVGSMSVDLSAEDLVLLDETFHLGAVAGAAEADQQAFRVR